MGYRVSVAGATGNGPRNPEYFARAKLSGGRSHPAGSEASVGKEVSYGEERP